MITTTRCIEWRRPRGFTLAEVMIATALGAFVLTGVLSTFLFIGRSSFGSEGYSDMANATRGALELFAEDARGACDIHWNSAQSITLTLPTDTNDTTLATYAYDSDSTSPTYQCFYRLVGDATATTPRQVLVRGVTADFAFARYKLNSSGDASAAGSDLETKQIQLTLRVQRNGSTAATATDSAVSACYILRNKHVSN
jgi:prepilin-type N-terminal cleavage/methylation domain-containing protein